jgi:ssDNA-binding Zn-finger/Zn-ribbon topoisomerase 1
MNKLNILRRKEGVNMANEINRICPHCGSKLLSDSYKINKQVEFIVYCNNDNCPVKPCTDSTIPSRVYNEVLAITGDRE